MSEKIANIIAIELQKDKTSVKSVKLDMLEYEEPNLLDKVYAELFKGLNGDSLVVELLNDEAVVVSVLLEPNAYPISEIVEYLSGVALTNFINETLNEEHSN